MDVSEQTDLRFLELLLSQKMLEDRCAGAVLVRVMHSEQLFLLRVPTVRAALNIILFRSSSWHVGSWVARVSSVFSLACRYLPSVDMNLICLACSLSGSVLYRSESSCASLWLMGIEAAMLINLGWKSLLTEPSGPSG